MRKFSKFTNQRNVIETEVVEDENSLKEDGRANFVHLNINCPPTAQNDPERTRGFNVVRDSTAEIITTANNNEAKQIAEETQLEVDITNTQEFCDYFKIKRCLFGRLVTKKVTKKVTINNVAGVTNSTSDQ